MPVWQKTPPVWHPQVSGITRGSPESASIVIDGGESEVEDFVVQGDAGGVVAWVLLAIVLAGAVIALRNKDDK